jgi:hypothetical protein
MTIMKRPTLLGLMILIAYLAIGLAAIRSDDALWAGGVMYLTAFILSFASLVAIDRRGAWAGFAVFGWASFLIFNPNAERGPSSLSMLVAAKLVLSFTKGYLPYYSLSAGLSLSSVAIGLLGALLSRYIGPATISHRTTEGNPLTAARRIAPRLDGSGADGPASAGAEGIADDRPADALDG